MTQRPRSPFDDASGEEFLKWFAQQGGAYSQVFEVETAGTTADDANQAYLGTNVVRATAAGAGLKAPPGVPVGAYFTVINASATHSMKVWPADSGINLNARSAVPGAAITVNTRTVAFFQRISATEFVREP